jgi:hypothetical protein
MDLRSGKLEQRFDAGLEAGRLEAVIDIHFELYSRDFQAGAGLFIVALQVGN